MAFQFNFQALMNAASIELNTQMQNCQDYLQRSMVNIDFDGTAVSYLPYNVIEEFATFENIWTLVKMQVSGSMILLPDQTMSERAQYIYENARRLFVYTIYCGQSLEFVFRLEKEGISDRQVSKFHRFGGGHLSKALMEVLGGFVPTFRRMQWAPILDFSAIVGQRIPFVTNIPFASNPVLEGTSPEGGYREYRVQFHARHIIGVPYHDSNCWYTMRVYDDEYGELEDVEKKFILGCFFYEEKTYWLYQKKNGGAIDETIPGRDHAGEKNDEKPPIGPFTGPFTGSFMGPISRA